MKKVAVALIERQNAQDETEYLLVSTKRDYGEFTGFYQPAGGHVEEGETESEAVARELFEELQLVVEPIEQIAETDGDVPNYKVYWWRCKITGGEMNMDESELAHVGYFTKEQIETMNVWPATKRFFETFVFNAV